MYIVQFKQQECSGGSLTCKRQQSFFLVCGQAPFPKVLIWSFLWVSIRAAVWAGELAKPLKARLTAAISRVAVMLDHDLA